MFEIVKGAVVCQITFEFRDKRILAIEAARLIEYADKSVQQRIGSIGFIRLLIDVEQNRRGWYRQSLFKLACKHLVILCFGLAHEGMNNLLATHGRLIALVNELNRDLAQNMRQHLQQVRFTGTEETGNPCTVLFVVRRVVVCVKEFGQIAANLLRQHILVDLIVKVLLIIGLDHTIDIAVNVLAEQLLEADSAFPVHLRSLLL